MASEPEQGAQHEQALIAEQERLADEAANTETYIGLRTWR
jgi:hypothetical protein